VHKKTAKSCTIEVGSKQMYDKLARFGFEFGPTFRTLNAVSFSEIRERTVSITSTTGKISCHLKCLYSGTFVHPVPIDAMLHLTVTAFSREGWKLILTLVSAYVEDLWMSHKFLSEPGIQSMNVSSRSRLNSFRETEIDMIATYTEQKDVLITMHAYSATAGSSLNSASSADSWRHLCFRPLWKLDVWMRSRRRSLRVFIPGQVH
jgi:hypothetical protein